MLTSSEVKVDKIYEFLSEKVCPYKDKCSTTMQGVREGSAGFLYALLVLENQIQGVLGKDKGK